MPEPGRLQAFPLKSLRDFRQVEGVAVTRGASARCIGSNPFCAAADFAALKTTENYSSLF
jgi:hypothetical protein